MGVYVDDEDAVHLQPGSTVDVEGVSHTVRELRRGNKGLEVAFVDVTDRNQAEQLRGKEVMVGHRRELTANEYWPSDLIGLAVRPEGGEIVDVVSGPAQDRLVISRDGKQFEVPFVEELVPVVDVDAGYVEVVEIEGLSQG